MNTFEFRIGAVNASECIIEGWNLIKSNYGLFIGMIVVEIVIAIIGSLIPYAGSIINLLVGGALTCGIYMALLAQRRGENPPFTLMFEGFSRIVPTTLVALISALPWLIFGAVAYTFIALPNFTPETVDPAMIFNRAFLVPLIAGYLAVFFVSMIFHILLFFALPLIADRNASIVEAIKSSAAAGLNNAGGLIALFIFETLLMIAGALACGIGIIFVLPIVYAANIVAYKSVFPDDAPQFNTAPPRPDEYGGTYGTPR